MCRRPSQSNQAVRSSTPGFPKALCKSSWFAGLLWLSPFKPSANRQLRALRINEGSLNRLRDLCALCKADRVSTVCAGPTAAHTVEILIHIGSQASLGFQTASIHSSTSSCAGSLCSDYPRGCRMLCRVLGVEPQVPAVSLLGQVLQGTSVSLSTGEASCNLLCKP